MADASFPQILVPPLFATEIALPATDLLGAARQVLLEPTGLTDQHLARLLGRLMAPGVDMADLYFQHELHESWSLEDSIIKGGSHSTSQGVGVRAVAGERTGLAYAEDLDFAAIDDAARAARAIVKSGQEGVQPIITPRPSAPMLYPALNPLDGWPVEKKLSLLKRADEAARAADPRVIQVMANLNGVYEVILVADEQGRLAADVRPLVRLNVSVIVEQDGRREQAGSGQGGRGSYETFFGSDEPEALAAEAVRQATLLLTARPAPAGAFPVVLGPGWPGVLLHEAVGHTLEGDFNRKGSSLFSGRVGQRVVSDKVTVVDDGTLAHRRGSLTVDDEGTPAGRTVMIENGILKGYIQDRMNARLMGVAPTGNGRRESFAALPMPRMTNTYMTPGTDEPEDILRSVKDGIYAVNFGGGQVDITTGNFTFSASEAYRIENGRITYPVRGATLVGNGIDVLERISMVGHDLALDKGIGVCGKEGQSVPVGVGQPTLKIDQITVGGTKGA